MFLALKVNHAAFKKQQFACLVSIQHQTRHMNLSQYYAYRSFYTARLKSIFLIQHFLTTHIYFGKVLQTNSVRSLHIFLRSNELLYDRYHTKWASISTSLTKLLFLDARKDD